MNERTHFFIKIYLSHFILERVDVGCVWEVSWRRGQTATYWPQVLLTIAALLSHPGWVAQPWVTEGPKPSVCRWLSIRHLLSNWLQLQLTQAVCVLVMFLFDVNLLPLFFRLFTQVHHLIDGSVEGQYVTSAEYFSFSFTFKLLLFIPEVIGLKNIRNFYFYIWNNFFFIWWKHKIDLFYLFYFEYLHSFLYSFM